MGDRSLQSSIWAPGNRGNENSNFGQRAGDWDCPSCRFSNYQWRKECFRCSTPKSGHTNTPTTDAHQPSASLSNTAQTSGYKAAAANGYQTPPLSSGSTPDLQANSQFKPAGNGLATSRWAPRRTSRGEAVQVWTRTIPAPRQSRPPSPSKPITVAAPRRSRPSSPSKPTSIHNSSSPDLGLPYQVQHYILAMIQRILEEGCFDFASRWLPQVLHEKGWDCSEAVELSTWKTFLPTALPPTAIKPLSNYTLEAALADAVRIRNSAVHRHLCDNNEIRKMALQAQDLMSMFSDATRQNKFHHLWVELTIWDSKSRENAVAARAKLEGALREISETPIDDMDWTPNAVSLQELQPGDQDAQPMPEHYGDEMELD